MGRLDRRQVGRATGNLGQEVERLGVGVSAHRHLRGRHGATWALGTTWGTPPHFTAMGDDAAQEVVERADVGHRERAVVDPDGREFQVVSDLAVVEGVFQPAIGDGAERFDGVSKRRSRLFHARAWGAQRCLGGLICGGGIKGTRAGGGRSVCFRTKKIAPFAGADAIAASPGTGGATVPSAGHPRVQATQAGGSAALGRAFR